MVIHEVSTPNGPPKVRHFISTINLGVYVPEDKRSDTNVVIILNRFEAFAKQTDADFRIESLNGSVQCITNPSNIPNTKDGVDLYYQHRGIADGIRG
jgi:hypothetical protein